MDLCVGWEDAFRKSGYDGLWEVKILSRISASYAECMKGIITSIFTPSSFLADVLGPVLVPAATPAREPSSPVATLEESLFRGGMIEV